MHFTLGTLLSEDSCPASEEEHEHLSADVVLEPVMTIGLIMKAVVEAVVPLGLAKAGFLSGCP